MKTIEKVIKFCTVLKFFLSDGCEDRDMLWAFFTNLSIEYIYLSIELCEKWPYFQNYHSKKINTVHNLITFSIVFTNKNRGGGTFSPRLLNPFSKTSATSPLIVLREAFLPTLKNAYFILFKHYKIVSLFYKCST